MHLTFGHKARFIAPVMTTSKKPIFSNVIRPKELNRISSSSCRGKGEYIECMDVFNRTSICVIVNNWRGKGEYVCHFIEHDCSIGFAPIPGS